MTHALTTLKWRAHGAVAQALKDGRLIRPHHCEECGKPCKPDAHHHDYAKPLEVRWICRRCHMLDDGRLADLQEHNNQRKGTGRVLHPCGNCGVLWYPLRRQRCRNCYNYRHKYGCERPYTTNGYEERRTKKAEERCQRCQRPVTCVGDPVRGYCTSCYSYLWRKGIFRRDLTRRFCHLFLDDLPEDVRGIDIPLTIDGLEQARIPRVRPRKEG